jgi:galactonate dehydratase
VGVKITAIKTLVVNAQMRNWVFVRVETDQPGLYGWGEATLEWKTRAVVGAVQDLEPLLLGRDPRDIEQAVRVLTKHSFWRLGVIGNTAISGIEMALWDIWGKELNVPVWRLLGGKTRDQVKIYTHLGFGSMTMVYESLNRSAVVERALQVTARGYRALKVVFIPYTHYTASPREIEHVAAMMHGLREAVGDEVEIMIDFHGRCASTSVAVQYIDALAPSRPLFVEEPIQPGDAPAMKQISDKSRVPIATGERLVDRREFDDLFRLRAINIAQPDLCHVGGFSEARKIAAMADTAGVGIAPHNPLGPLAGVAALHFDIATPNFVIQEEMSGAVPWYHEIVDSPIRARDGHWLIPERPGLGVEINEAVAAKHPYEPEIQAANQAVLGDGTIVDW